MSTANSSTVNELLDKGKSLSLTEFVNHVVPKSLFEALANNEILQILVFALVFGIALASFGEKGAGITRTLDVVVHVILKMVGYIMWVAPVAVFGTIAAAVAINGLLIFKLYGHFLLAYMGGMITLWLILIFVGYLILGKRVFALFKAIKSPLLIAFSTTSSEAVFPKIS